MKIVIDIHDAPREDYQDLFAKIYGMAASEGLFDDKVKSQRALALKVVLEVLDGIVNGTPLPDGAEILTKEAYSDLCMRAADVSSVEPERKTGHWEWDQRAGEYVCSECGCNPIYERTTPDVDEIDKYRYCRWCGAPMEVQDESDKP